jgi:hypothetical protein
MDDASKIAAQLNVPERVLLQVITRGTKQIVRIARNIPVVPKELARPKNHFCFCCKYRSSKD